MLRPKKYFGQHFLNDQEIAQQIVDSLSYSGYKKVLEIGPGMGVLTNYLAQKKEIDLWLIEIDDASVSYLENNFPHLQNKIISGDFLEFDIAEFAKESCAFIGNFPYNISTQILFKVYENKNAVVEVVGMFQKEVAQRIASPPGSRRYGILSVLLQSCYDIDYLFTVDEHVFAPVPKVKSGVIRLKRNFEKKLLCDEKKFKQFVKTAFNQRRKTLRNALMSIIPPEKLSDLPYHSFRAEQLSWKQFEEIVLAVG